MAQTVLITGATSGVGLELARGYREAGARLLLVGRRDPETLDGDLFSPDRYCQCDLARDDVASEVVAFLDGLAVDRLDLLIHNAAVGSYGPVTTQTREDVDELLAVNLYAPVTLTHALLPRLRRAGGRVVAIGSVAADLPAPDYAVYAATKAALAGFVRNLRAEGVPTQLLVLGPVRTGLHRKSGLPEGRRPGPGAPDAAEAAARARRAVAAARTEATLGLGPAVLRWFGRHAAPLVDDLAARGR